MVRPDTFGPDDQTLATNAFQSPSFRPGSRLAAQSEADVLARALRTAGVEVHVVQEPMDPPRPNAVFPNNWFSTHPDGTVVVYPLQSPSRRPERDIPILETLRGLYRIDRTLDLTCLEPQGAFLEGTGSLVLDHDARRAFACLSPRTDPEAVSFWCRAMGFEPVTFVARGRDGRPVYHTNVVMALGEGFAAIGSSLIDEKDLPRVREALSDEREVIDLALDQIEDFAGNMLALRSRDGRQTVVMSERAWACLNPDQRSLLSGLARIVRADLPTIEQSGGSARCMLAEVFLPPHSPLRA
jgi:hypothetical protein